ncbi:MAG: DUF4238 domain-containing protein [Halopseudomonas sp.]|uniref:DUF4238 domain-containing protein n=1 Tax=Halopseudomonas sp. TaxID=2901191 RepID=UPI003002C5B4
MATNKNQHYVPRCYLKAFTYNSEGKAINVFNLDRSKCIPMAPVKNQCSRDYFYGNNEKLESAIQFVEQAYASTSSELLEFPQAFNKKHEIVLKRFWLLQYLRTEASSRRSVEMSNGIGEAAGISAEEYNLGIKEAVLIAMKTYAECMSIIDDLKVCLVLNKTECPFISSDDPAVLSNKWHLNDPRTKFKSFGLRSSGNLLFLPLSPKLLCLLYDGGVYSVSHKNGLASISKKDDVKSFNEHQILNCRANVYLKDIEHEVFVVESIAECRDNRLVERHRTTYAVLESSNGDYSRYVVIDPTVAEEHEKAIIHSETMHYHPTSWPIVIKWRNKGTVYTNGTGVGYVRKHHAVSELERFYKEPVRQNRPRA